MTAVLKIGGSVLTDKSSEKTIDQESFRQVLDTVSQYSDDLVLIHGAGSFGHPQAERTGLKRGTTGSICEVYQAVMELNDRVIDRLESQDVNTYPIHPSSCCHRGESFEMMTEPVRKALQNGYTPVLHGDSIMTSSGARVVSGDLVARELAVALDAETLGMCTARKGVLDTDSRVIEEVNRSSDFSDLENDNDDVTGGIPEKVRTLLSAHIQSRIFGPDQLEQFLEGGNPGTLVKPE